MRIESLHGALAYFPDIDGLWQADNMLETESNIRAKLPATGTTGGWTAENIELLTLLARVQGLQGNLIGARGTLDQAQQLISEFRSTVGPRVELRWLLEQGRIHCLTMTLAKAHDFFAQAWDLANKSNEVFFAIDSALMLSTVRPPKFQNEWLQRAMQLAQTSQDSQARLWLSQLFLLEGWHAFDFRNFEKALENFTSALKEPAVSETKSYPLEWSRARTLRALGRLPEALAIQEQLMARMRQQGKVNGHVYLEIAECKQLMKDQEEAKSYFELAYAELSADGWYSDNRSEELSRMKYIYKKR